MYLEIDPGVVPRVSALREPDDFASFKVALRTVIGSEHARRMNARCLLCRLDESGGRRS